MSSLPQTKKSSFRFLLVINILCILLFSLIYFTVGQDENNFGGVNGKMSFLDAFYFSITTQTTLGYGDIYPNSSNVKMISIFQQFVFIFELIFLATGNFECL